MVGNDIIIYCHILSFNESYFYRTMFRIRRAKASFCHLVVIWYRRRAVWWINKTWNLITHKNQCLNLINKVGKKRHVLTASSMSQLKSQSIH